MIKLWLIILIFLATHAHALDTQLLKPDEYCQQYKELHDELVANQTLESDRRQHLIMELESSASSSNCLKDETKHTEMPVAEKTGKPRDLQEVLWPIVKELTSTAGKLIVLIVASILPAPVLVFFASINYQPRFRAKLLTDEEQAFFQFLRDRASQTFEVYPQLESHSFLLIGKEGGKGIVVRYAPESYVVEDKLAESLGYPVVRWDPATPLNTKEYLRFESSLQT